MAIESDKFSGVPPGSGDDCSIKMKRESQGSGKVHDMT